MDVMTTSEIVGDIVQIILTDTEGLERIGVTNNGLFLKVTGMDDLGLWVEHPNYVIVQTNDASGKPLPDNKQIRTELEANFLLRWEKIVTVVHFPNREGFDFPNPMEDRAIGFITDDKDSAGSPKDA